MTTRSAWADAQTLVAAIIRDPEFERLHPRGRDGRFLETGGLVKFLDPVGLLWRQGRVDEVLDDGRIKVSYKDSAGSDVEEVKHRTSLYSVDKPKATLNPAGWKKVGAQAGSNPGGFFEDDKGEKWYVKTPKSQLHAANENLANRLYRAAGAPAPETAVSANGKNFLTKIESSSPWSSLSGSELDEAKKEIAKNFVVDAWLANWDAPLNDNLRVTDDGVPLRVDSGGAVLYRARGNQRQLTPNVGELQTMRDPSVSYSGARLYDVVTRDDEEDGVKRILAISPATITKMVADEGLPSHVATSLIARRAWLATHYGYQLPETTDAGRKLLADLARSPEKLDKTEADKITKTVQKIAPETAVPLAKGAPVWVQDKTAGSVQPAGSKVPDVMVVDAIHENSPSMGGNGYDLVSMDGKVKYVNTDRQSFEVLRENFASERAKYSSGESPQVGDRVDSGKLGKGIVVALFPLYMKVQYEDGKSRVGRIARSGLVDKVGSFEPDTSIQTPQAAAVQIGEKADVTSPESRFPVIAYSLPHRVSVLVLSNDPVNKKSVVMLSDGRKATVPDDKLYNNEVVDRDKVAAIPTRKSGPRKARVAPTLDVTALPKKEGVKVNSSVAVDFEPGDRIIKIKKSGRAEWEFLIIRKNGVIEYAGSSKRGTNALDNRVFPHLKYSAESVYAALQNAGDVWDVTPPKYDVAAEQLGAKTLDWEPYKTDVKVTWTAYDPNTPIPTGTTSAYGRRLQPIEHTASLKIEPGDKIEEIPLASGPVYGVKSRYDDPTDPNVAKSRLPMVMLTRGGVKYYIGWGAEHANDSSEWIRVPENDVKEIKRIKDDPWYQYSSRNTGPEPVAKLSIGEVTKTQLEETYYGRASNFNQQVARLTQLMGLAPAGQQRAYSTSGIITGQQNLMAVLSRKAKGWDSGAAAAAAAQAEVPRTFTEDELAALKTGAKVKNADTGAVYTKPYATSRYWQYESSGKQTAIPVERLTGLDLTRDLRPPTIDPGARKYTPDELDRLPVGTKLREGQDPDSTAPPTGNVWKKGSPRWENEATGELITDDELSYAHLEAAPGSPTAPSQLGVLTDITAVQGFDALHHRIETTRDEIRDGKLDDRIHEIMTMDIKPLDDATGRYRRYSTIWKLPDGSAHGDPYMAQFSKDQNGDQNSLLVSPAVFNAIKDITGKPTLHRGVSTQDQRDAIKNGEHFTGTGVSGNGTYTAADTGTAGSYGGNKVQLTPKPGARIVQNDEAAAGAAEDVTDAMMDRFDALSKSSALPSLQDALSLDLEASPKDKFIAQARDRAAASFRALRGGDVAAHTEWLKQASTKAAVATYAAVLQARSEGKQINAKVEVTSGSYYYDSSVATEVKIWTADVDDIDVAPLGVRDRAGVMKLKFENPKGMGSTRSTRAAGSKLDATKNFSVKSEMIKVQTGRDETKIRERIGQSYNSGWFLDQTTEILEQSGVGETLADSVSDWQKLRESTRKIDSRISFISDPGRWALSSGYDAIHVPYVDYYIFTNRAAFVIKK